MSANESQMRIENVKFHAVGKPHKNGVFLGYAKVDIVVPNALPDGSDFKFCIRDIEVKILNDAFRLDFKSEFVESTGKYIPIMFPKNGETRAALTDLIFSDPTIDAAVVTTLNIVDATEVEAGA